MMQGIEFVNELCCNYLTVPYEGEEGDFALRMITENAVDAFLPIELRRIDEQTFLYYNISGMQNMEILYGEKPMDRRTFQNFMWQLHKAMEESCELFLPGDGICLEPVCLFREWGTERWKFLYIPVQRTREPEETQRERENLTEFLVMHMDYEDRELTEAVYRFYEGICTEKNFFWNIETQKMYADFSEEKKAPEKEEREEIVSNREQSVCEFEEEGETEKVNDDKDQKRRIIPGILLCAAIAVTFVSGRIVPAIVPYGAAISALLAAVFLILRIRRGRGVQEEFEPEDIIGEELQDVVYKTAGEEYKENDETPPERTVYMEIENRQERKLYGMGKCRRQKIFLERLPCLVGKEKTLADYVIEDASVSRMHAKFWMEQETVWMQDLNSTNGTYHNGIRLTPNEKVALETEDEIRFGQAQFVFR